MEKAGNGGDCCWSWALKLGAEWPPLSTARHNHHQQNSHRSSPPRLLLAHPHSSRSRKQGIRQKRVSSYTGWHFGTPMARVGVSTWVFAKSRSRRRTTNGRRTKSCCFRQVPSDAKHQTSKMSTAQAQHGPWHQQVTDYKRQLQTVLNPGRPIHLRQHRRLACAFVHLCALDSPALHSMT